MLDQVDSFVLFKVSSGQVIVLVMEDSKLEIFGVWYVNIWSLVHKYNYLFKGDHWSSETIVGWISQT